MFSTNLTNAFKKTELMLKFLQLDLPTGPALVENFKLFLPDATLRDLQIVLDMRGVAKKDLAPLLRTAEAKGISPAGGAIRRVGQAYSGPPAAPRSSPAVSARSARARGIPLKTPDGEQGPPGGETGILT